MKLRLPSGRYKIQQISLDDAPTALSNDAQEFRIDSEVWEIWPANRRFEVIHCNNRAAALRLGGLTYFAEFTCPASGIVVIQLRRENCKQVYRFDLKLMPSLVDAI